MNKIIKGLQEALETGPVRVRTVRVQRQASLAGLKEFGEQLITTGDLDPIYVALVGANLDREQVKRWLLAYWMFYHAGMASYASERTGGDYWAVIERAAYNFTPVPNSVPGMGRWPRGTERRHFRGDKCVKAVRWFMSLHPETYVETLYQVPGNPLSPAHSDVLTHKHVIARVSSWPQFGPWIAFKAADMLERCLGVPVQFSNEIALLYKEPAAALDIIVGLGGFGTVDLARAKMELYRDLEHWALSFRAPPLRDRPCSHQEIETVLCKYKSHLGGHYPIGKDTWELREGLKGWGETAEKLLAAAPVIG
jgi:hypothetical protein